MIIKKEYSFLSADKETKIHVIVWTPEKEVIGVVQIAHGMVEFIDRYDRFARFLNQHGYVVVGNDHLKKRSKRGTAGLFPGVGRK